MNASNAKGYILTVTELRIAITGLEQRKADRPAWVQRLLLSALAEVHASGNHTAFTRLATAASLPKAERGAIIEWCESNTWLSAIIDSKKKFQGFKKEKGKHLPSVEESAKNFWYALVIAAKEAKKAAEKADAERAALMASLPTETAPTETAPTETAPTETEVTETAPDETAPAETAPAETAPAETPVDERTPQELDDAELAIDLVRMLSDTQFADFAAFFAQEKERRELTMIAAIRKAA